MHSSKKSKFITQRPSSSARVYDTENSDYDSERKSRIPKRTYSLEGKESQITNRHSSKNENSTTSMIPRLERGKACKKNSKPSTAPVKEKESKKDEFNLEKTESSKFEQPEKALVMIRNESSLQEPPSEVNDSFLESKINQNFSNFKSNVLRIPEYWSNAGHTVTNILKNAINVVAKQYPTADVEAFESEIQNILKATEMVKHQILSKTQDIINQANKIYVDRSEKEGEPSEEELEGLARKMEELRNEVHARKNVFEELLKCGSEMKHLIEIDKELNEKMELKDNPRYIKRELQMNMEKKNEGRIPKRTEIKKSKMVMESAPKDMRRKENVTQSCGDVLRQNSEDATEADTKPGEIFQKISQSQQEDKFTQTINLWTAELHRRDKDLATLNGQILELHKLCKDHISKFKSFNLQIKLRGICNKAQQHTSISKEIKILNDEKMQLEEKNNKLQYYSKDLETAIKKKNLDLYQKEKVINQQKRLLNVRDELIEMLKTRCNIEVDKV